MDQSAWPEGVGAIKLGFADEKRQLFSSDDEFKQAYLNSVKDYEKVRRALDEKLDAKKLEDGIDPNQPVAVDKLKGWIKELSQLIENKHLFHKESMIREAMDSFSAKYPLAVGDVVTVPRLVPHALQHGVRVVEFQTPVYERKILSFAQKVLTQDHWDTEEALGVVNMDFSTLQPPEVLSSNAQISVERIVNFDDFEVRRVQLEGDYLLTSNDYSLVMVVQGILKLKGAGRVDKYDAGHALLVPKTERGWSVSGSNSCIFLITSPL